MSRRRAFEDNEITLSHQNKRPRSGLTSYDRYTVAWMCALHIEMAAARAMLDEEHDSPPKTDSNSYVLGTIHGQHVVMACLPASAYGTNNAAIVMSNLKRTFPNIDVCLMVGIGGGVPGKADIRLGDIVVGMRVMQYDLGKTINGELQRTGVYKHPGLSILTVISNLRSRHELEGSRVPTILKSKMEDHPMYGLPTEPDRLFEPSYQHPCPDFSCDECDQDRLEVRKTRSSTDPVIYYGGIASSNQVMKDATCRDKIASELDVLCFEMEAAGLMDMESCLPIRGICDYADSHKAKGWQRYAAATAAAYAYELLEMRGQDIRDIEADHPPISTDEQPVPSQRHEQLLKSLNFEAIDTRKTTIKPAHKKTCQWFLKHKEYLAWKDPDKISEHHGFLWIRGKPGAGKSTIMKFIYLDTKKSDEKNKVLTASFFFNARGETLEKTISGMYRSLLLQLFKGFPDLQCVLDDSDVVPQSQSTCPSLNCLKDLLRSAVLKLGRRSFTCFIDALDECDEQQVMDLVYFFEGVAEICVEHGVRLRICFSSRHYPYIDIERGMRLTVENQEGHAGDLESYIESNLRIKDPGLVTELQQKMLVKASGVFLWVVLVVDVLNDENRRGRLNLRKRLEEVPNGLSELFKDIIRRDNTNAKELQLCLLWILLSKRPLRSDEFYHALWSGLSLEGLADAEMPSVGTTDATQCFYKSVVSSSKGLAEVTKAKRPTVQFIHESVRDFLIKDKGLAEIWPELKADWESFGHNKLKRCCDFYFKFCITSKYDTSENRTAELGGEPIGKTHPFVVYACQFVLDHANCAAGTYCQQDFMSDFPISHWVDVSNQLEKHRVRMYSSKVGLFYVLADRGYSSLIRTRLKTDPHSNSPQNGERYIYPLIAAMAQGHKNSVIALLGLPSPIHEGVDITKSIVPNVNSGGKTHTPLSWACEYGHLGIAKLLLQRGAFRGLKRGFTLLMHAAKSGRIEVVEWLLDIGEDIRASNNTSSVISLAVESGNTETVKVLLDRGIEVDAITPKGMPILSLALSCGNEAMAMVILNKGADVQTADLKGRRPVHFATSKAVLKILFDHGADLNVRDHFGETCFWNAIEHLKLDALSFLIEHGVDVNTRRQDGKTCLFSAARLAKAETINFLCNNGANINAQDNEGNICLHRIPCGHEYFTVVKCLLKHGANPNARDSTGQTFLHSVASQAALQYLFDHDLFQSFQRYKADMNVRDPLGNTPLHIAVRRSGKWVLNLWLSHGADINLRNNQGETPLDVARFWNNQGAAHCLTGRGAESGYKIADPPKQVAKPSDEDHGGESRG